jgi:hypothetical protein
VPEGIRNTPSKQSVTVMIKNRKIRRARNGFLSNHHFFNEAEESFPIFVFPFIRD